MLRLLVVMRIVVGALNILYQTIAAANSRGSLHDFPKLQFLFSSAVMLLIPL